MVNRCSKIASNKATGILEPPGPTWGAKMGDMPRRTRLHAGVALSSLMLVLGANIPVNAQNAPSVTDAQLKALQAQIDQLQQTVKQLQAQQSQNAANSQAAKKQASEAQAQAAQAKATAT